MVSQITSRCLLDPLNDEWLNAVYIEDVLYVLIVAERSQSAPLNDVDYARWEFPAILLFLVVLLNVSRLFTNH